MAFFQMSPKAEFSIYEYLLSSYTAAKYLQEIKFFGASCIEKDLCMYASTFYLEPCSKSLYPFMETSSST